MSGWTTKKLGEVCEILDSRRIPITRKDRKPGHVPYYGATGQVDSVADYIFNERLLLLGEDGADWSAGANSAFIIEGKSWVNNHAHVLRPLDFVSDCWLMYYLNATDLNEWVSGTTVPKLNQRNMCDIPIPIPPLAEQKRIVAKIDAAFEKIDRLKANAEKNLANAKELFQSALDEAMRPKKGWVEKRLGEVCEVQLGKMLDKAKNKGNPYKYLANLSVRWRSFGLSNLRTMPFMDSEVEKFSLRPGDILMCEGGEPGRCAIWQIPDSDIKFQKAVHRIRSRGSVEPAYLVAYFESIVDTPGFQSRLTGATIKHLPRERLIEIPIPIPPLPEQRKIAKRLDLLSSKLETLQQNYARQIADCAEMRQAILREAFEGRL